MAERSNAQIKRELDEILMKRPGWHERQLPSGRRVIEKSHGNKVARVFQGESHWTVALRGSAGEITRRSARTLSAAKSLGTKLLK